MIVRRLAAGVAVAAFTMPLLATAPHPRSAPPANAANAPELPRTSERILARADAAPLSAIPANADPARAALARAEYDAWAAGKPDLSHYAADDAAQLQASIPQVQAYLHAAGAVKTFAFQRTTTYRGLPAAVYLVTADKGAVPELIAWNAAGKIRFIVFGAGRG